VLVPGLVVSSIGRGDICKLMPSVGVWAWAKGTNKKLENIRKTEKRDAANILLAIT
jgi:hypothetical protein